MVIRPRPSYFLHKERKTELAQQWRDLSSTLPIHIEAPTIAAIWMAAGLKARYPISYADSFAVALAQRHGCPVLTGDPEFQIVEDLKIEWMGR